MRQQPWRWSSFFSTAKKKGGEKVTTIVLGESQLTTVDAD